jgi:chromosome segregation ATPase
MIRSVFLVGAVLFLVLLGVWIKYLREQNDQLKAKALKAQTQYEQQAAQYKQLYNAYEQLRGLSPQAQAPTATPPNTPPIEQLRNMLQAEQQILDLLNKKLADRKAAGDKIDLHDIDDHIESDEIDIQHLQEHLAGLKGQNQDVSMKSKDYLDRQNYDIQSQKADLQNQIQAIDQSIGKVQGQITALPRGRLNPNWPNDLANLNSQLADLRAQRAPLASSVRDLDLKARAASNEVAAEVRKEQSEVQADRESSSADLKDLKDDLAKWQKTKADTLKSKSDIPADVAKIQKDIALENTRISDLQKQIQYKQKAQ